MDNLKYDTAVSLGTEEHVYCEGTLAQCFRRWERLTPDKKAAAYLKMGRDGGAATFLREAEVRQLTAHPQLASYRWR